MTQSLAERPCEQGFDHQCKWCHVRLSSPTPPKEHEPTPDWEKGIRAHYSYCHSDRPGDPCLLIQPDELITTIRHTIAEAVREERERIVKWVEETQTGVHPGADVPCVDVPVILEFLTNSQEKV